METGSEISVFGDQLLRKMGLLSDVEPLEWNETKPLVEKLKWLGIEQFIRLYHQLKWRQNDCLKWGDEIEYMLVKFDHENKRARLLLRATEMLKHLTANEKRDGDNEHLWRPEFAEYMIEGTPGVPYGSSLNCFNDVEENMRRRRKEIAKLLQDNEHVMTMPCFPRLGCLGFTSPSASPDPNGEFSKSLFFPDEAISDFFPRYRLCVKNIRQRRGSNVAINVPVYRDENTPCPFREDLSLYGDESGAAESQAKEGHIFADTTGCATGCCCLQVTLQAVNIDEARLLYDQLTPITPIMLALSAATPIYRGYLADVDTRWHMFEQASDDRTEEERGLRPLTEQKFRVTKSRYGTTDCYLDPRSTAYNDVELQYDKQHLQRLLDAGVDRPLAQHIAHLFIRDPLQVFQESVDHVEKKDWQEDDCQVFEDIQSSNWRNMRFKPPPPGNQAIGSVGWRVEFRPMEVQLTDFENAAYVCFVVLLSRVVISSRLSFLIPISKVDENMEKASKRDAVLNEKFYFRDSLGTFASNPEPEHYEHNSEHSDNDSFADIDPNNSYTEMTVDEIINGKPPNYPGLVPLIERYLDSVDPDLETRRKIEQYLALIRGRASGDLWTLARFMREFVLRHPDYGKDSVVSDVICYDLMKTLHDMSEDRARCPKLNGPDQPDGNKAMGYLLKCSNARSSDRRD